MLCGWHRPREQWWCVREVPKDRCNASEKRLVYSSPRGYSCRTPSVRYISDDASFCTYTVVEKELVPWHMLHHDRENVPMLRHPGIVPHFETRTVNKFWACVSSHSKLLHAILNCKPVHTDHNLNGFPLRSVLVLGYKYYYAKMTAHSSSTPHPQKQTSHSASFPCVCHG